ncbi:unnamed protein product [Closterium sp. Yama58-4]|nr:unnamed protein product [Closterium sp. Yama58-4]
MCRGGGEIEGLADSECSFELRPATVADYELYVSFFPDLSMPASLLLPFDTWQRDLAPSTYFLVNTAGAKSPGGDAERNGTSDGAPLAYVFVETLRDSAFIRHIVVHREKRRQGMGTKLMRALAARLAAAGCRQWRLNVFPSNTAAVRLYSRLGLSPVHSGNCLLIPWKTLLLRSQKCPAPCNDEKAGAASLECNAGPCAGQERCCGSPRDDGSSSMCCAGRLSGGQTEADGQLRDDSVNWSGLERVRVDEIEVEEEEQLERGMGLPLGMLQRFRELTGTLLAKAMVTMDEDAGGGSNSESRAHCEKGPEDFGAEDPRTRGTDKNASRVIGLAVYQESYGGFKVFRASSPEVADKLLEWFGVLGGNDGICTLLVEACGGVVQWLKAMGATTRYKTVHMAGNVPKIT